MFNLFLEAPFPLKGISHGALIRSQKDASTTCLDRQNYQLNKSVLCIIIAQSQVFYYSN